MNPDELLELFDATAQAVARSLEPVVGADRRARTARPGQYALDLVADEAALLVLGKAPVRVLSEESDWSGPTDASITVVIDPVDGSTNASRGIPYWATSLCALDGDGPLAALVVNHVTGTRSVAIRGRGSWRDGQLLTAAKVERVEEAVVALSGLPGRILPWRQYRAMGSSALALCDVAGGVVEGYVDAGPSQAPWDYLGALLVCTEAGVSVVEANGRDLVSTDSAQRMQVVAAATPPLLGALLVAVKP